MILCCVNVSHAHAYFNGYVNDNVNENYNVAKSQVKNVKNVKNPKLDTRISFVRPSLSSSVTLRVPPQDSEMGWTGELWSGLDWKTKRIAFFGGQFFFFIIFLC